MADGSFCSERVRDRLSLTDRNLADISAPLRGLARAVARQHGADVDDLHQLALEIACRRAAEYRPADGSFLTFVYARVRFALHDACHREARERRMKRALRGALDAIAEHLEEDKERDPSVREENRACGRMAMAGAAIVASFAIPETPEVLVADAEESAIVTQRVAAALAELGEKDRLLVVKTAVDGLSIAEAAREIGIGYEGARKRLAKGLERLGRRLRGLG